MGSHCQGHSGQVLQWFCGQPLGTLESVCWVSFCKIAMVPQGGTLPSEVILWVRLSICPGSGRGKDEAIQEIRYDCLRGSHLKSMGKSSGVNTLPPGDAATKVTPASLKMSPVLSHKSPLVIEVWSLQ